MSYFLFLGTCPACGAGQQLPCRTPGGRRARKAHAGRPESDHMPNGKIRCEGCGRFKFLVIHSCPRVLWPR